MTSSATSRLGASPEEGIKAPCKISSQANLTLSGLQTVNGTAVVAGDRVLVRAQTAAAENGLYEVATGLWTRTKDFNKANDVAPGVLVIDYTSEILYKTVFTGSYSADVTEVTFLPLTITSAIQMAELTPTVGQTVFTLPWSYTTGVNNLWVIGNGSFYGSSDFAETDGTTFTTTIPHSPPSQLIAISNRTLSVGTALASAVSVADVEGPISAQKVHDRSGIYHFDNLVDTAALTLTSVAVGRVLKFTGYDSNLTIGSGSEWKVISLSETAPDAVSGINSDGYYYQNVSTGVGVRCSFVGVATTAAFGFVSGDIVPARTALDNILASQTEVILSEGTYPDYSLSTANVTLISTKGVIFKLPDNTSTASTTEAKMALEISAIGITIEGDITVDGNSAGNDNSATDLSDRRGAFAVNHDRFTLNGSVIITSAYWVGISIGTNSKIAYDTEIDTIRVLLSDSYATSFWACDRWVVGAIFVENPVQGINNRIRTGSQGGAPVACKNGTIGSIIGLNTYCVFEVNTVQLSVGTVICSGGKTEDCTNVTIQSFTSQDLTIDANGFTSISSDNIHIYSLTVLGYDGDQAEVVQFSDSSSSVTVDNITVNGTVESIGNPRHDVVVYGADGLNIGSITCKGSLSTGGIGLLINNTTTITNLNIDRVDSSGHNGNDVHWSQFNDAEVQVNHVNTSAVTNTTFPSNVGRYDEESATVILAPQTSGTITTSSSILTSTRRDRLVTVTGTLIVSSVSSPVGSLRITGLPFSAYNARSREAVVSVHCRNLASTFVGQVEGVIRAGTDYIELWRISDYSLFDLSAHIQATTQITVTVTYPVR